MKKVFNGKQGNKQGNLLKMYIRSSRLNAIIGAIKKRAVIPTACVSFIFASAIFGNSVAADTQEPSDPTQADFKNRLMQLETCTKAFNDRAAKLAPLNGKIPVQWDAPITKSMLRLARKPTGTENQAFHAYSDAVSICGGVWASTMVSDLRPLMDGNITYAQFNKVRQLRHDEAKKIADEAVRKLQADIKKKYQTQLDDWYKGILVTCGSYKRCAELGRRAYDDASACNGGNTEACNRDTQNQTNLDKWSAGSIAAKNQAEIDIWYKESFSWCGADTYCSKLAHQAYDDASACNAGNVEGCNRGAQNQANLDKWHTQNIASENQQKRNENTVPVKQYHAELWRQGRIEANSSAPNGSLPPAWNAAFSYAIWQGERFDRGEISSSEEQYLVSQKFAETNEQEEKRIRDMAPNIQYVPVQPPVPAYQAPHRSLQTDFTCLNDCTSKGYMYQLCMQRCSY